MTAESKNFPVLEARQVSKVFRDFWYRPQVRAVQEISFEVGQGEIFGLLGPNGSGKSTTIKMLLGLLVPSSGTLRVLGKDPRDVLAKSRIGYLSEESVLYPYLTAGETLDFYGRLFHLEARERNRRTTELLEMIGLTHARHRPIGEFSKGMARRIGLAQALINDPDLIILDEPTAGLDPLGCRQVKDLLLALARRGKTVLLCSHLLADVETVCDRIAILYGGQIRACGPVNELLEERDRSRLLLPAVSPQTMRDLLRSVREILGQEPEVDHPRKDLERYFLDVVAQARRTARDDSSGAHEGAPVAAFLAGDVPTTGPKGSNDA